jgi:Txe/YoeB family toxin of Txe-Axe toxin-antitoxin module
VRVTHLAPTTSLSFVHTARRYYRLNDLVRLSDRNPFAGQGKMTKLYHLEEVKVVTRFP